MVRAIRAMNFTNCDFCEISVVFLNNWDKWFGLVMTSFMTSRGERRNGVKKWGSVPEQLG